MKLTRKNPTSLCIFLQLGLLHIYNLDMHFMFKLHKLHIQKIKANERLYVYHHVLALF